MMSKFAKVSRNPWVCGAVGGLLGYGLAELWLLLLLLSGGHFHKHVDPDTGGWHAISVIYVPLLLALNGILPGVAVGIAFARRSVLPRYFFLLFIPLILIGPLVLRGALFALPIAFSTLVSLILVGVVSFKLLRIGFARRKRDAENQ